MKSILLFFITVFVHGSAIAHATTPQPVVIESKLHEFSNDSCLTGQNCDLERFSVRVEQYYLDAFGDRSFGTRATSRFNTTTVDSLQKFAVVQFIRGCQFLTDIDAQGNAVRRFGISRHFFDETVVFSHPAWVIDSVDRDPVYNSDTSHPERFRHFLYRWNTVPGSTDRKTERFFGLQRPDFPEIYVTDLPGQAVYYEDTQTIYNISLQFRTCLYRTVEVPLLSQPDGIEFADPIACFDWQSSYVYDFDSARFESPAGIDPFCQTDPSMIREK